MSSTKIKAIIGLVLLIVVVGIVWYADYKDGWAIKEPPEVRFVDSVAFMDDVSVSFEYEGENIPEYLLERKTVVATRTGERFMRVSKIKDRSGLDFYGDEEVPIFRDVESHSYQGSSVYIKDNTEYVLEYVGLRISDLDLISALSIEFGIDFALREESWYRKILATVAEACGPGIFLREIGGSELIFAKKEGGTSWYRLAEPIALYEIPNEYCTDEQKSAIYGQEEYAYCGFSVDTFEEGNLRMHLRYVPNDKEGLLRIQFVGMILKNKSGLLYQASLEDGFTNHYRAYLQ